MAGYVELTKENFDQIINDGVTLVRFLGSMVWTL